MRKHGLTWQERHIGGHVNAGHRVTIYGCNAMHYAVNVWTKRWGWVCFRPTTRHFGRWWHWYLYASRDGTPSAAVWGFGPGYRDYVGVTPS